ncbi:MAG: VanZ family protein [Bacteroidetes bacterium]|nr:VanZ family protein [Bacteroidota bacterium]
MFSFIKKNAVYFALSWTAVIFGLCCIPGRYIPTTTWLELISFDKFVHASIFFVLQTLWMLALNHKSASMRYIILASCVAYGGSLEIMQATVFSQRSADWFDFIANSFGCVMAILFFRKINAKFFHDPVAKV